MIGEMALYKKEPRRHSSFGFIKTEHTKHAHEGILSISSYMIATKSTKEKLHGHSPRSSIDV